MPSIFSWIAATPLDGKETIDYYVGSDWFAQDDNQSRVAYQYISQTQQDGVIIWEAEMRGEDWVGCDLLEIIAVPYKKHKEDAVGCLEQLGKWMRCRMTHTITLEDMQAWCVKPKKESYHIISNKTPLHKHRDRAFRIVL